MRSGSCAIRRRSRPAIALDNEIDWIRAVEKALGAKIHKAKSNSPQLRNGAIWQAMDKRGGYAVDRAAST
jgi:hypothetical protein